MPPSGLVYLTEEEIIALHEQAIRLYGGMPGVRDPGALQASAAQPASALFGHERFPGLAEKAAAYCYFIVRNHPFFDGNKRAGFLAALHFLRKNGLTPFFDEVALGDAIMGAATGEFDVDAFAERFNAALRS